MPEANGPTKSRAAPDIRVALLPGGNGVKSATVSGSEGWAILAHLVDALWLSLHRVNLAHPQQGQPFIGVDNYLYAFRQTAFWHSFFRTLYFFTAVSVGLELALGLLFAVLLNERFRGNLAARLVMLFPWGLLTISNGVLWAWILNPTYGVANTLLVGRCSGRPQDI